MADWIDVAVLGISTLASGAFALGGVSLAARRARDQDRRSIAYRAAEGLAETEALVWGDSWIELQVGLERLQAQLEIGGASPDLVNAWRRMSVHLFQTHQRNIEMERSEDAGVDTRIVDSRRDLQQAIRADLLADESEDHVRRRARVIEDANAMIEGQPPAR